MHARSLHPSCFALASGRETKNTTGMFALFQAPGPSRIDSAQRMTRKDEIESSGLDFSRRDDSPRRRMSGSQQENEPAWHPRQRAQHRAAGLAHGPRSGAAAARALQQRARDEGGDTAEGSTQCDAARPPCGSARQARSARTWDRGTRHAKAGRAACKGGPGRLLPPSSPPLRLPLALPWPLFLLQHEGRQPGRLGSRGCRGSSLPLNPK